MSARISPYIRLRQTAAKFASAVAYPKRILMWRYPTERLNEGWQLTDLYQRAAAAKQLGYDVIVSAADDGLQVHYVQQRPEAPPSFWS